MLDGAFSRLDYQRNPKAKATAVPSFTTLLPAAAQDVYYRDIIGNISTSNFRVRVFVCVCVSVCLCLCVHVCVLMRACMQSGEDNSVLEVRPRFPLFGGWRTYYTVGYNLPASEALSAAGSAFSLTLRFVVRAGVWVWVW